MSKNTIEIKRVIFHDKPDFILSLGQWESIGGYRGFLKHNEISILDIKKVVNDTMSEGKFFSLNAWEG